VTIALGGCSATVTSNNVALVITQHADTLTLAPGQTAAKAVLCDTNAGEALISGGYAAPDLSLKSTVQLFNNITSGGIGHLVLGNYPSDAGGSPPSAQGQVELGWTVRATNPLPSSITLSIYANCLKGNGVSTLTTFSNAVLSGCAPLARARGVASTVPASGCGASWEIGCPSTARTLTGGGWSSDDYLEYSELHTMSSSYPFDGHGVNEQRWVFQGAGLTNASVYAVCATKVYSLPPVSSDFLASPVEGYSCYPAGCGYLRTTQGTVGCPTGAVLVGGGFNAGGITSSAMGQPTLLGWTVRQSLVDTIGYFTVLDEYDPHILGETVCGVCATAKAPKLIFITFSNYHHLLRIPADTVVVATDGSGQIRAGILSARVSQARSQPIAAEKTINPFTGGVMFAVPSGCGSPTLAINAATSALTTQLKRSVPSGQVAFGSPAITPDHGSLTCSPVAGTQSSAPFTYTEAIDATATEGVYDPKAVVSYQEAQLQQATQALVSPYTLRDTLVCPGGPQLLNATSTRATLQCAAYGVAEWPWSADQLHTLALSIAGKTKDAAQQILDTTPGIEAHSAEIDLPSTAGGKLPANASDITIILVRPQDTAPVLRAP
jgi:hypothetical protein